MLRMVPLPIALAMGRQNRLEPEPAGDAEGARLGEEGREDLPPARELRIDERPPCGAPAWKGELNATWV